MDLESRFWAKVEKTETCWLWTAGRDRYGYGKFSVGDSTRRAHRLAYELVVGPISDSLTLDHLCRVRHCVRPDHLEPVPNAENIRRGGSGQAFAAKQRAKTHCPQGHPYNEANTYWRQGKWRQCRACATYRKAAFLARQTAS